jgi:hypothetical protein
MDEVEDVGNNVYESMAVKVKVYGRDGDELGNIRDLTPSLEGSEI